MYEVVKTQVTKRLFYEEVSELCGVTGVNQQTKVYNKGKKFIQVHRAISRQEFLCNEEVNNFLININ